jgi:hypothetical protein
LFRQQRIDQRASLVRFRGGRHNVSPSGIRRELPVEVIRRKATRARRCFPWRCFPITGS